MRYYSVLPHSYLFPRFDCLFVLVLVLLDVSDYSHHARQLSRRDIYPEYVAVNCVLLVLYSTPQ
jgi:hypothetical protein